MKVDSRFARTVGFVGTQAVRAVSAREARQRGIALHREHDDCAAGSCLQEVVDRGKRRGARHVEVEKDDLRPVLARATQGLVDITGLRDDIEAFLRLEHHPQTTADHRVVVGEDDRDPFADISGVHHLARVLRRTITGEIALLVAVLTVSGALVSYAPPAAQSNSTPRAVEREASGTMDDLHVEVGPGRTGPNRIDIYAFRQSDGLADKDLRAVRIIATPPGRARPVALISRAVSPGHFTVSAAAFTTPGAWTLELTGRSEQMPGMPPEHAVVRVPID